MADLQKFSITAMSATSISLPRTKIEAQLIENGVILADFTGSDALIFPTVIATLSTTEQAELIDMIATWIIYKKAGLT